MSLFEWAPFRYTRAAIKLHTLLDQRGAIPAFIHISDGKLHDVNVLDMLTFEAGAFYVMDRGYVDFERLYTLHQAGAFFVTRTKSLMDARRVYWAPTERDTGVICDQRLMLNGYYSARKYYEHLRRIRFKDPHSRKPRFHPPCRPTTLHSTWPPTLTKLTCIADSGEPHLANLRLAARPV